MCKIIFLAIFISACSTSHSKIQILEKNQPKLVLLITVDQMPREFVTRFRPFLKKGLGKLLNESIQFTNASHGHAITETCPGHAALATGHHPSESGIIGNSWFNRKRKKVEYCVFDKRHDRSPKNLLVTAFPDWIKKANPKSKVFSVSAKDRAAIMLGGKRADAAYWYDTATGYFTSSSYYKKNKKRILKSSPNAKKYFGTLWQALESDEKKWKQAKITYLDQGVFPDRFPHVLGVSSTAPTQSFFNHFYSTPYVDTLTREFAEHLLREEKIGTGQQTDYLAISFSALDTVGHIYGPNSPEVFDSVLRLDANLQHLLNTVDRQVGLENTIIAFSSDHGIMPFPEYDHKALRINSAQAACEQGTYRKVTKRLGKENTFIDDMYFNQTKSEAVDQFITNELEKCPHIEKVWAVTDLKNSNDSFAKLFRNSFYPKRSPNYIKQTKAYHLSASVKGTDHGSPYAYDRDVPLLIRLQSVKAKLISHEVQTIDLAPTLADLLNIPFPSSVDGRSLLPLIELSK